MTHVTLKLLAEDAEVKCCRWVKGYAYCETEVWMAAILLFSYELILQEERDAGT